MMMCNDVVRLRHAVLGLAVLACAGSAFSASEADQVHSVEAAPAPEPGEQQARFAPQDRAAVLRVRRIELTPLPLDSATVKNQLATLETARSAGNVAVPRQIGFAREVPALKNAAATSAQLAWQVQADGGQAAAISLASPGALGVRLGVRIFGLPEDAVFRIHAPGEAEAFEARGAEILDLLEANAASGDRDEDASTWWTPVIDSEEAVLEIILPPGASPGAVEIALPTLSHLFASARTGWEAKGVQTKAAALSCHQDVNCQADWDLVSRATALLTYVSGGQSYICTGTLLNDTDKSTFIPYFLTGNHCISSQTQASTLSTYWFHRSPACNGQGYDSRRNQLSGGATLLYQAASTDTAFLRLNGTPPGGAVFAGWRAGSNASGQEVTGVHSPVGERQKIAFGAISAVTTLSRELGGPLRHPSGETNTHIEVIWNNGATEAGSSGSGLFDTSSRKLIGQLHGGEVPINCSGGKDYYGRFDLAYKDKLHEYLNPAAQSVRLDVARVGSGTVSGQGIDCGTDCSESYASGSKVTLTAAPASGYTFSGWSGACSGSAATCTVTLTANASVTATFLQTQAVRRTLTVQRVGNGTVSGQGISCGTDCSEQYASGSKVTLTAAPASGYIFSGWSGACSGSAATCTVTLNANASVTATFTAAKPTYHTLSVRRSGLLGGSVTGTGINCGSDCSERYTSGTQVTLTAKPPLGGVLGLIGYSFTGWGGACASAKSAKTCTLKLDADASVSATFGW
ncbi:MAG: InlB B-repeat-containing protein [Azoarcus sp.]|jgi:uncharacterized repeat protein (TIGR02543 family)|nr:InlB B-repeat-containing protein [Azoarcus sp.]